MSSHKLNRRKPVTSFDVARLARVSASTVSLVLNGKALGRVSPENQKKVHKASKELAYNINAAARSLRLGNACTIGLFVPNVINPFFAKFFQGAQRKAYQNKYNVLLVDMMDNPEWQVWLLDSLAARKIDGCILYSPESSAYSTIRKILPYVVLVEVMLPESVSLLIDVEEGARVAMRHLLDMGHIHIAYLDADYKAHTFQLRSKAYREMLQISGIGIRPEYIERTQYGIDNAIKAANRLLKQPQPPTAIFCADDLFVPGVYKAARDLGIRIPDDLSVIGFDDSEISRILEPDLTTVAIPAEKVGEESIEMMLELLRDEQIATRNISTKMVIRNSTAPVHLSTYSRM